MKILIVNKYHYYRGGAETYVLDLGMLLEKQGNSVLHFSMHHPENLKYKYDNFFVPYIDFANELSRRSISSKLKVVKNMFYSKVARKKFSEALNFFKPDIIHLHNIHKHITISILYEAKKRNIPVVWTLHDYQIICPNYTLRSHGEACERCKHHNYLAPLFQKCVKDSFQASLISAFEKISNDIQGMDKKVNLYLAPSAFLMNKVAEFGINKRKIVYLHNFFDSSRTKNKINFENKYFLYLGRISKEKGVATLCEAAKLSKIKLKITGDGPLRNELETKYASNNIEFTGYKTGKELEKLRRNAWFLILPSECYENNPFAIIESFSEGVPAIGAKTGGIPELVKENKTGLLFESRSVGDLMLKIVKANNLTSSQRNTLGRTARKFIVEEYNSKKHYQELMQIYKKVIAGNKK